MKREFLKSIEGLTEEAIDKIMAENGKDIEAVKSKLTVTETELQKAKTDLAEYQKKVGELEKQTGDNSELKKQFEELQAKVTADKDAAEKAKADETLTANIIAAIGDKKFVNEYTKKSLISEIKAELTKPENSGKGIDKIFSQLTNDKEGIFANPNPPVNMRGMGNVDTTHVTKEQFDKMGYKSRNDLFQSNPVLYKQLQGE